MEREDLEIFDCDDRLLDYWVYCYVEDADIPYDERDIMELARHLPHYCICGNSYGLINGVCG